MKGKDYTVRLLCWDGLTAEYDDKDVDPRDAVEFCCISPWEDYKNGQMLLFRLQLMGDKIVYYREMGEVVK